MTTTVDISALAATKALAQALAADVEMLRGKVMYLYGDLGAGKTTLIRYLLRALGEQGLIKSPTYGLLECYQPDHPRTKGLQVLHLDLYRLEHAEELEYLGLRELLDEHTLMLVEWPEHGFGGLPPADIVVKLSCSGERRLAEVDPDNLV